MKRFRHPAKYLWPPNGSIRFYRDGELLHRHQSGMNYDRMYDVFDHWNAPFIRTYNQIGFTCRRWKHVTKRRYDAILWRIAYDFEYEGFHAELTMIRGEMNQPGKKEMRFQVVITSRDPQE